MRHSPDTLYLISQHGAAVKTILSVRHSKPLVCNGASKNGRSRFLSGNSANSVRYPAITKYLFCFLIIQILHRASPKMPTLSFWHSNTHPYQNSDWCFYFWLRPSSSKNHSFRPSVCLSVCVSVTPFWQCSCHRISLKLSGVITIDRRDAMQKVKVTEVMTPLSRFRTVTPVWIRIRRWNDAQSLKQDGRGALLIFEVIRQMSRSHG